MYENEYVVKAYKYQFDKNGKKKLAEKKKEIIKDEKLAHKRAWILSEESIFVTIEKTEKRTTRLLTIGKIEK